MILITCVSNDMGVSFNKRRQSRDAVLCSDILEMVGDSSLRIHPKSEILFPESKTLATSEKYLQNTESGDFCFYEGLGEIPWADVDSIVMYRWNRDYPSDVFFNVPKEYELSEQIEFSGKSHTEITKEKWIKK